MSRNTHNPILLLTIGLFALLSFAGCGEDGDTTDPGGGDPGDSDTTAPQVTNTTPSDGAIEVDKFTEIVIIFSEEMDPTIDPGDVTLSPNVANITYTWSDPSTLVIGHDPLPHGTENHVILGPGLSDLAGNGLNPTFTFSYFTMADFALLEEYQPGHGATEVNRAGFIDLRFNTNMDIASLLTGIAISDVNKTPLGFSVEQNGYANYILYPTVIFEPTTEITVDISDAVTSSVGPLNNPLSFSFTTSLVADSSPPTIVSIDPPGGTTFPADQGSIQVEFSEPVGNNTLDFDRMNGQLAWALNKAMEQPFWNNDATILTIPLPANLPAGLALEASLVSFEDIFGNQQISPTTWSATVAGTADPYPLEDGGRFLMTGEWSEGLLGETTPTDWGELWIFYETAERATAGEWEIREYEWEYSLLDFYEIHSVSASGVDMLGFAENMNGTFSEFLTSSPITMVNYPMVAGNTATSSASFVFPDGTFQTVFNTHLVGQVDLVAADVNGIPVTWTDVWYLEINMTASLGGQVMSNNVTYKWFAPGIGLVRDTYTNNRVHPDNDPGWTTHDRWLHIGEY